MLAKRTIFFILLTFTAFLSGCIIHDPGYYPVDRGYYAEPYYYGYYGPSFYTPFVFDEFVFHGNFGDDFGRRHGHGGGGFVGHGGGGFVGRRGGFSGHHDGGGRRW